MVTLVALPSTIGIVGPTYTGHADAWQTAGHEVKEIKELPDWGEFSTVIVTNPNNLTVNYLKLKIWRHFLKDRPITGG